MVANVRGYTTNFKFKLVNFDTPRWHTLEYANWQQADILLKQAGLPNVRGYWENSTSYKAGEHALDEVESTMYRVNITHTSASSGTFAQDRAAHPTYWVLAEQGVPVSRGPWAPNTVYNLGDTVSVNNYDYYLCTVNHTSGASFNPVNWQLIFSGASTVNDANTAKNQAQASAAAAANSAGQADARAFDAQTSATQSNDAALNSAASATNSAASATNSQNSATAAAASATEAQSQANSLKGTSATDNPIDMSNKTFTTQAGKQFNVGNFLVAVDQTNVNNWIGGQIISYSGTTLTIKPVQTAGSGVVSDWNLYIGGTPGGDGVDGEDGVDGAQGPPGPQGPPGLNGDVEEAPINGSVYARQNGLWVTIPGGSVIASGVAFTPGPNISSTNVQAAVEEVYTEKANVSHTHPQSEITNLTTDIGNINTALGTKAPLASPALTGTPTAPTAPTITDNTQIATTAFVKAAMASGGGGPATGVSYDPSGTGGDLVATNVQSAITELSSEKAPKASPTFTGTLSGVNATFSGTLAVTGVATGPTAAADTNTTQLATTAFVLGQAYGSNPAMNGTASPGSSLKWARGDHVHPTDTSLAPLASPALTGNPTAPTQAVDNNSTRIATTAYVIGQASASGDGTPAMNGTASRGTAIHWARADHIHPTDSTRAPLASPTFTGTPAAPTANPGTNTTQLATCAFVLANPPAGSVLYNASQSLTAAQTEQARKNITAANHTALSDMNVVVNASLYVAQQYGLTPQTVNNANPLIWIADQWYGFSGGGATAAISIAVEGSIAPAGYQNSLKVQTTTTQTSPSASHRILVQQSIEIPRAMTMFQLGTASAVPMTLNFWVRSSLTGNHAGCIMTGGGTGATYAFEYNIAAANTWEYKTILIPACTIGTWGYTDVCYLNFTMMAGTAHQITKNTWTANATGVSFSGAVNVCGTLNATWYMTGAVLMAGAEPIPQAIAPLAMRTRDKEWQLCLRYYQYLTGLRFGRVNYSGGPFTVYDTLTYLAPLRSGVSSSAVVGDTYSNAASLGVLIANGLSTSFGWQVGASTTNSWVDFSYAVASRL